MTTATRTRMITTSTRAVSTMIEPIEHGAASATAAQLDRVAQIGARRDAARRCATTAVLPVDVPEAGPPVRLVDVGHTDRCCAATTSGSG
jgi:hypothetical protein